MKILFVDLIYDVKTHHNMNVELINGLRSIGEVDVFAKRDYYVKDELEDVNLIEYCNLKEEKRYLHKILNSLKIMYRTACLDRKNDYDYIWVSTFETKAFAIGRFLFKDLDKVYLMHQNNTDALSMSPWNMKLFNTYKMKVHHVVAEKFFAVYLQEECGISESRAHYLPHPAYKMVSAEKITYECAGLSNTNDESLIKDIIEKEKNLHILKETGKKVILRSKIEEYDDGYLKVIKGYLKEQDYRRLFLSSKKIYMPFPQSFRYRISGTLIEAMSARKRVIATSIALVEEYRDRYPGCCEVADDADTFFEILKTEGTDIDDKIYDKFLAEHNVNEIKKVMREILMKGF